MRVKASTLTDLLPAPKADPSLLSKATEYSRRILDNAKCRLCQLAFSRQNPPRNLVVCGHVFCSTCLPHFAKDGRVECPACERAIAGVDLVDDLPALNSLYFPEQKPKISDEQRPVKFPQCSLHWQKKRHLQCLFHHELMCSVCFATVHKKTSKCKKIDLAV